MMLSRRTLTSGLLALPALSSTLKAQALADIDIAIIGAGAAGLGAAHRARELGLTTRIFEARSRVGGRVHTDMSLGAPYEAGAFYIHWAERNPWRGIAKSLGIEAVDDAQLWGGFDVFRDGKPLPPEERWQRRGVFGRISAALENETGDLSFADAARKVAPDQPQAGQGLTLLSLGEEAHRISLRDYQQLDGGEDDVIPSGYGAMLRRYSQGLDIALETPVLAIDWSGSGVTITTSRGVIRARALILTVSMGVLQAGSIRFTPELPVPVSEAIHGLGMGALTKLAMKFEGTTFGLTPWTQYFDSGRAGDLINFEFWPFGQPLVVAHFGGDFARSIAAAGQAEAVRMIHNRLVAILGEEARKAFRGGSLAGWSTDPHAMGCYSHAKPGHLGARAALEAPVANRIWLAGEANAGAGSMTAGGATLAGWRAVDGIKAAL